jgi:indolepyruvate ferredoxin oxidoreductase beta subunit
MNKNRQLFVSGIGGQGVLFVTRVIAEAAVGEGLMVLTSETHGMAQRGGTVISMLKIGDFKSPLLRRGQADIGLFLHAGNLDVHRHLLKPSGHLVVNAREKGDYAVIDASGLARRQGNPVLANLILLGHAVCRTSWFCSPDSMEMAVRNLSRQSHVDANLAAFRLGCGGGD